jgi:hypothetical protein
MGGVTLDEDEVELVLDLLKMVEDEWQHLEEDEQKLREKLAAVAKEDA